MIAILTKYSIYEDWNHDRSAHKNVMFLSLYRIAIRIVVLFIRITAMIAVLTKNDRSPHKNVMFLSLYRIAIMITILFIKTTIMVAFPTKMPCFESLL